MLFIDLSYQPRAKKRPAIGGRSKRDSAGRWQDEVVELGGIVGIERIENIACEIGRRGIGTVRGFWGVDNGTVEDFGGLDNGTDGRFRGLDNGTDGKFGAVVN